MLFLFLQFAAFVYDVQNMVEVAVWKVGYGKGGGFLGEVFALGLHCV